MDVGVPPSRCGCAQPLDPVLLGYFVPSSCKRDPSSTPFAAPLPSLEDGGRGRGAENRKLLILASSFW